MTSASTRPRMSPRRFVATAPTTRAAAPTVLGLRTTAPSTSAHPSPGASSRAPRAGWLRRGCRMPHNRRYAARIIGNSVAPPVTAWIGSLAAAPFARKRAVARMASCIRAAADLRFFQTTVANGWGHGAVQWAIEARGARRRCGSPPALQRRQRV